MKRRLFKKILAVLCMVSILCSGSLTNPMVSVAAEEVIAEEGEGYVIVEYSAEDYNNYRPESGNIAPVKEGYVFAGWYSDKACGVDYVLRESLTTGKAYAKFVDKNVLSVKLQLKNDTTGNSENTDIRILTSVDSLDYSNVGFDITFNGQTASIISKTVYKTVYGYLDGNKQSYTPDVFSVVSQYFMVRNLSAIPNAAFDSDITITPKWTTLDGTTVPGISRTFCIKTMLQYLCVDFFVEVEEGREPVVLQITDPQIIDSSQARSEDRLWSFQTQYWAAANKNIRCYDYLTEVITNTKPDLILVTGDIVYGEFDDDGSAWLEFIEFMDKFQIPWAPIFGNHENESAMGVEWQCRQLLDSVESGYCLFKQRELTGNGNYTVGIKQGEELKRVFFMLDSNGCGQAQNYNTHTQLTQGFGEDQIAWYKETAEKIKEVSAETKLSMAFHIPLAVFADAVEKYGVANDDTFTPVSIDSHADKQEGDFGYVGTMPKGWDTDYSVWNGLKKIGVDSIFVGHQHIISSSVVYEGVRLQYGQKSSTYDNTNFVMKDGTIVGGVGQDADGMGTALVGGTVMKLSETDGSISDAYIYLCVEEISEMIDALPAADSITLPQDVKYISEIKGVEVAYNVLTEESKAFISDEQKAKLEACIAAIEGYETVLAAETSNMTLGRWNDSVTGELTVGTDSEYGPVFLLNITGTDFSAANEVSFFYVSNDFSSSENVFFHIYNPTASAVSINVVSEVDTVWKMHASYKTLQPGWNLVELNSAYANKNVFAYFPNGDHNVIGEWKVTSFYGRSDVILGKENVNAMIDALPAAETIDKSNVVKYMATINEVKASYDALSDEVKNLISTERKEKLEACVAKIQGITTVLDASTNNMSLDSRNGAVNGTVTKDTDSEYGPVVKLNITTEKGGCSFFTVNDSALNSDNVFFYIYNPTGAAVSVNIYNGSWSAHASWKTLQPGWNLIELDSTKKSNYVFASFPDTTHTIQGEWKVTSFYAMP